MDKREAIQIQNAVRDAVSNVLKAHSLILTANRASYTPMRIKVTLELSRMDAKEINQAAKTTWERYARMLRLTRSSALLTAENSRSVD